MTKMSEEFKAIIENKKAERVVKRQLEAEEVKAIEEFEADKVEAAELIKADLLEAATEKDDEAKQPGATEQPKEVEVPVEVVKDKTPIAVAVVKTEAELEAERKLLEEEKKILLVRRKRREAMEADAKIVRGRFNFDEVPGGTLEFSFQKYKEIPVTDYSLVDGLFYEIPFAVAEHLATTGISVSHVYITDETGKPIMREHRRKRRYSFESMAFYGNEKITIANSNVVGIERL